MGWSTPMRSWRQRTGELTPWIMYWISNRWRGCSFASFSGALYFLSRRQSVSRRRLGRNHVKKLVNKLMVVGAHGARPFPSRWRRAASSAAIDEGLLASQPFGVAAGAGGAGSGVGATNGFGVAGARPGPPCRAITRSIPRRTARSRAAARTAASLISEMVGSAI